MKRKVKKTALIVSLAAALSFATMGIGAITYNATALADEAVTESEAIGKDVAKVGDTSYATIDEAIAAATDGATIDLLCDVELSEVILIGKSLTINGNDYKVTSSATRVFRVTNSNVEVTLNGVNMVSTAVVVYPNDVRGISIDGSLSNVKLTLNNCSVDFTDETACDWSYAVNVSGDGATDSNHTITVNGGTYEGANVINVRSNCAVTVTNATLNSLYPNNDKYYGAAIWVKTGTGSNVTATGNTFTGDNAVAFNVGNTTVTASNNIDNTQYVVAKVGDTYYYDLSEAIEAAQAGDTITLLQNVEVSNPLNITKSITINGNSKTLTYTGSDRAIDIVNAAGTAKVTITDLTVDCTSSYCQRGINYNATGSLTLDNVTVTGKNISYALNLPGLAADATIEVKNSSLTGCIALNVWGQDCKINVTDSTLTSVDNVESEGYATISMNNDGSMSAEGTIITVTGGKIDRTGEHLEDTSAALNGTETGKINISDTTEVDGEIKIKVAIIWYGTAGYSYSTLAEAIEAAQDGDTITLLQNVEVSNPLNITKSITIDGNGKTLTYTGSNRAIDILNEASSAEVTISNLTVACTSSYCQRGINYNAAGKLTLDNVTVKGENVTYALNLPGLAANATIEVKNSSLTGCIALNVWGQNCEINVTDSTLTSVDNAESEGYATISMNNDGSMSAEGTIITVTGGKIDRTGEHLEDTSAALNGTETGKINISDTTEVNGEVKIKVAIIWYGTAGYSYSTLAEAIEAAQAGDTITLLQNVELSEILVINKAITLDGNGKTLTSTAGRAINVSGADDVTIKNLTINASGERAINVIQKATNVVIENVTATAANYTVNVAASAPNAVVTIKNSDLTGLNVVNIAGAGANITVKNTTITCNCNSDNESYVCLTLNKDAVGATITATDIKFVKDCEDCDIATIDAENGVITIDGSTDNVVQKVAVIEYDENYYSYASLAEAIEAAQDGDTITLLQNVEISDILVINKAITLDGNSKTLTSTAGRAINVSGAEGVTIKNLTINASGERAINVIQKATNVTIENVTATAANYTVNVAASAPNAIVTIQNSALTGLNVVNIASAGANITVDSTKITCNDQNEKENYSSLVLNKDAVGATITATNIEFDIKGDSYKAKTDAEEGVITIDGFTDEVEVAVAMVDYGTDSYNGCVTLQQAINIVEEKGKGTVKLLRDFALSETVTVTGTVTIDLNGKTITGADNNTSGNFYLINNNKGNLTIKDSVGTGAINLTATNNRNWNSSSVVIANTQGTLTVEGGTIEHLGGTDMAYAIDNLTNGGIGDATTTINGGTIRSTYRAIRQFLNSDSKKNVLIINGGTIEGTNKAVFFHDPSKKANNGTLTIGENATVNGDVYLYVTSGSTEWPVEVSIAAAALTGDSEVLAANVPETCVLVNVDGTYGVVDAIAAVNQVGYTTLAEAFAAAVNGDTVKLLNDITIDTETYTIADGVSLTLDMNGKTLTVTDNKTSGNYELFYVYGSLTVTGNGTIELTATTDRDWNAMSTIFHNRGGVLTIENGTFEHLGGTDMAYVIDNSGNWFGDATTTIKDGTFTSTYTAIRNRMEQNEHGASGTAYLTVNGGTIKGETSAIWAQAASTSTTAPATGEINITGGNVGNINTARSAGAESMTTISGGTVAAFKGEIGELTVTGGTLGSVTLLTADGEVVDSYTITEKGVYVAVVRPFYGANLTIGTDLSVNFYLSGDNLAGATMNFVIEELDGTKLTDKCTAVEVVVNNATLYKFTFKGVGPHLMGQTLTGTLTVDGSTSLYQYSIAQYAYDELAAEHSDYTTQQLNTYHAFLVNLLNYGAAAQQYFDADVEEKDLVTANLTDEQKAMAMEFRATNSDSVEETKPDAEDVIIGKVVVFGAKNRIQVLFKDVEGDENGFADWTVTVYGNGYLGETLEIKESEIYEGYYYVEISDLYATELDNVYAFIVTTGTSTYKLAYSAETYVYNKQDDTTNTALSALVRALWNYGMIAEWYIGMFN